MSEVTQATLGVENLPPDTRQAQQVVSRRQRRGLGFDQHPGNGGGVAQVYREFQVGAAEKGVLAGQATDQAGEVRVAGEILVPERLVAGFADAVEAMATSLVQGLAE